MCLLAHAYDSLSLPVVPDRESFKKAGKEPSAGVPEPEPVGPLAACPSAANVEVQSEEAPLSDLDSASMEGEAEISLSEIIMSCPVPAPGRRSACNCVRADFVNRDARCLIACVGFEKRATVYRAVKLPKMIAVSRLCEEGKFAGKEMSCWSAQW